MPVSPGLKDAHMSASGKMILGPESYDLLVQGHLCWVCWSVQQEAWPEVCLEPYCDHRMRDGRRSLLDQLAKAEVNLEKNVDLSSDEPRREQLREKGVWLPD